MEIYFRHIPDGYVPQEINTWILDLKILKNVSIRWPLVYQWEPSIKWVDSLLYGFQKKVKVEFADIIQLYDGIVMFEMILFSKLYKIAIDYSDYTPVNKEAYRNSSLYFKMQYSGFEYDGMEVIPGGFIPNSIEIYDYLPKLRSLRDKKIFKYDVYGRFSLDFSKETREFATKLLNNQKYFNYEGGMKKVRYVQFLSEVTKSKVCIDLPGNGDFCFRLIDYFSIGACVIAKRHKTELHVPLVDNKHIVYMKDDMSDLVDLCNYYINHDDAREEICRNSRAYFDKYLHREQLSAYYLYKCLGKINYKYIENI